MANFYPSIDFQPRFSVLDAYLKRKQLRVQQEELEYQHSRQEASDTRQEAAGARAAERFGLEKEDRLSGIEANEAAAKEAGELKVAEAYESTIDEWESGEQTEERAASFGTAIKGIAGEFGDNTGFDLDEVLSLEDMGELTSFVRARVPNKFEEDREYSPGSAEKDTEYFAELMGITDPKEKARLGLMLKSRTGTGKDIGPTQSQMMQQNELWQEYDTTITNVEDMIANVEEDPTLVGIVGSTRKAAQTMSGIAEDFTRMVGEVPAISTLVNWIGSIADEDSELTEEQKASFSDDPKLSQLRLFEHNLGYALARSRQPRGRLLADTIKRSMEDAKLTGLTSSRDVLYRMNEVLRLLKENRTNVEEIKRGETAKAVRKYIPGQGFVDAPGN